MTYCSNVHAPSRRAHDLARHNVLQTPATHYTNVAQPCQNVLTEARFEQPGIKARGGSHLCSIDRPWAAPACTQLELSLQCAQRLLQKLADSASEKMHSLTQCTFIAATSHAQVSLCPTGARRHCSTLQHILQGPAGPHAPFNVLKLSFNLQHVQLHMRNCVAIHMCAAQVLRAKICWKSKLYPDSDLPWRHLMQQRGEKCLWLSA